MSVRRSLAWAFSGQFLAFAIQFAGLVAISRLLTPGEVGIYTISVAALGIAQALTAFGVIPYIVRETELTSSTLESAFTINAILVLFLSAVLVAISFFATPVLGVAQAGPVLRIIAVTNLFAILNFRPSAMLQREMQFKQLSLINIANVSVQALATIGFALGGASYMSPAYSALCAGITISILTMFAGRRHIGFRMSRNGWRPITTFGMQMMSVSGVAIVTGKLSELILGRILGVAALGLYGRASGLSDMIFNNLYGTATRVLFVQLSRDYRDGGDWRATYLRSLAMLTAVMWPLLMGLAVLAGPVILLLYGERWLPAALPLSALMVAQVIGVGFGMNWELFVLRGETGRQARYEVTRMLFGIPSFTIGAFFSIAAAGMTKIFDAIVGMIVYYPQVNRLAELEGHEIPQIYRDSGVLMLVAVAPSIAAMAYYGWSPRIPLPVVLGAVATGIALWLFVLVRMRHAILDELLVVTRRLRIAR